MPDLTPERLAGVLVGTDAGKPAGWIGAYFINYLDGEERGTAGRNGWPPSMALGRSSGGCLQAGCMRP